jgi:A/G-specific adenine glycosylase
LGLQALLPDAHAFDPKVSHSADELNAFQSLVKTEGARLYRDLPWRNTRDPYLVLLSEVMLQQTQVSRVAAHWDRWQSMFPTIDALAAASLTDVLEHWQGMGYNRRAVALKKTADICAATFDGKVPRNYDQLLALPGVGPSTAAGVCIFSWGEQRVYLETNVRTVYLHHLFANRDLVSDKEIIPLVEATCDSNDPRMWYYALLDYGSYLKKMVPNPSRRSKHHARQSAYEGSVRQKRATLLRELLGMPGATTERLVAALNSYEVSCGRDAVPFDEVVKILDALVAEGFMAHDPVSGWRIP